MNTALWIIAAVLAAAFLASGAAKLIQPKEKLVSTMPVLGSFGTNSIKAIGTLEILAAVGLVLPAVLDIAPVLVPLAAAGLGLLMAGAFVLHLRRREAQGVVVTLLLLAVTAFVAWGRFGPHSFTG